MLSEKTKGMFKVALWIWAVIAFMVLAFFGITADGLIAGLISLAVIFVICIGVSILISVATVEKEKLWTYIPIAFIIIVVFEIVLKLILLGLKLGGVN